MAKRVSSTAINWTAFRELLSEEHLPNFLALKGKNDSYVRRVTAYPAELPKIDWNYYRSKIAVPGLVDDFQKKYDGLKFPYPTDQGLISKIDEQEKQMKVDLAQFTEKVKDLNNSAAKELEVLKSLEPVSEMTCDEYYYLNPEIREKFLYQAVEKDDDKNASSH